MLAAEFPSYTFLVLRNRFVCYGTRQCYLLNPLEFGFQECDVPELGEGKYVGIGASKGVRIIEGPHGQGGLNAALIVDGSSLSSISCCEYFLG